MTHAKQQCHCDCLSLPPAATGSPCCAHASQFTWFPKWASKRLSASAQRHAVAAKGTRGRGVQGAQQLLVDETFCGPISGQNRPGVASIRRVVCGRRGTWVRSQWAMLSHALHSHDGPQPLIDHKYHSCHGAWMGKKRRRCKRGRHAGAGLGVGGRPANPIALHALAWQFMPAAARARGHDRAYLAAPTALPSP